MKTLKTPATALCALAAAMALVACQRNDDDRTAGQKLDTTVASAEQKAEEARADIRREATEARQDVNRAAEAAGDKVKDMSITSAVNAELARDTQLSALRINVDTVDGRVVLRGTAPNEAARERATTLASRVSGVVSVSNELSVATSG